MEWFKELQRKKQKINDRYKKIYKEDPPCDFIRDLLKELKIKEK